MLDDHIEEFLGPIKKRYEKSISGEKLPFDGKPFCSIYTTKPGFMPEEFINYRTGDGDKITFSILLPITPAEEKYITLHGYERFDLLFIGSGADMLDLDRPSLV